MTTTALAPNRPVSRPRPVASAIVAATVVVLGVLALVGIRLADSSTEPAPRPQPVASVPVHAHPAPMAHRGAGVAGLSGSPYSEWPPAAKATTKHDRNHDW